MFNLKTCMFAVHDGSWFVIMIIQLVCNLRLSRSGMSDTGSSNYSFRKSVIQRPVIEQVFYKTLGDPPHWTHNCYHVSTCVLWLPHWSYHCYYVSMSYDSHRWIHIDLSLRSPSRTVQQRKRWRTSLRVILATQSIFKNNPSLTPCLSCPLTSPSHYSQFTAHPRFESTACKSVCVKLSDLIKDCVKRECKGIDRFKLVCWVTIGQVLIRLFILHSSKYRTLLRLCNSGRRFLFVLFCSLIIRSTQ